MREVIKKKGNRTKAKEKKKYSLTHAHAHTDNIGNQKKKNFFLVKNFLLQKIFFSLFYSNFYNNQQQKLITKT